MLLRALLPAVGLCLSSQAIAQIPEPLDAALSIAPTEANPEAIVFRMSLGDESIRVAVDFEGEGSPVYRLIEPTSEDLLTEQQAEMWAGFDGKDDEESQASSDSAEEEQGEDSSGDEEGERYSVGFGRYDPVALREVIGDAVVLADESDGRLTYEFAPTALPGQGETPDDLMEHLRGEVIVDTDVGQLSAIRFMLTEAFKPNVAARVNSFLLEHRFVHEPATDSPRIDGVTMSMEGSAMFQSFSQSLRFDIEDIRFPQADSTDG